MIAFTTHNFPISKNEIWYFNNEVVELASYNTYAYSYLAPSKKSFNRTTTKTLWTHLKKKEEDIFNEFNSTTKNEIRKAEKENSTIKTYSTLTTNQIKEIANEFKLFSQQKSILTINCKRLIALNKTNNIVVTKSFQKNQELGTHIYLLAEGIALLMYSYHNPEFSKSKSYVNRFHHWKDIVYFKNNNFGIYDWGGIEEGLEGITNFKKSFGGEEKIFYNFIECNPLLYKLIKILRK